MFMSHKNYVLTGTVLSMALAVAGCADGKSETTGAACQGSQWKI